MNRFLLLLALVRPFAAPAFDLYDATPLERRAYEKGLRMEDGVAREVDHEVGRLRDAFVQASATVPPTKLAATQINRALDVLVGQDAPALRREFGDRLRRLAPAVPPRELRESWADGLRFVGGRTERNLRYRMDVLTEVMGHVARRLLAARRAGDAAAGERHLEGVALVLSEVYLTVGANVGDRERLFAVADKVDVLTMIPSVTAAMFSLSQWAGAGPGVKTVACGGVVVAAVSTCAMFVNLARKFKGGTTPVFLPRILRERANHALARRELRRFWRAVAVELGNEPEWRALKDDPDAWFDQDAAWLAGEALSSRLTSALTESPRALASSCAALLALERGG